MNKLIPLGVAALALIAAPGCMTITPAGPLAKIMKPAPKPDATVAAKPADASTKPMPPNAPPPPAPAFRVAPGEVSAANHADIARRLEEEMQQDRAAMDALPQYAEVSVVGGRR